MHPRTHAMEVQTQMEERCMVEHNAMHSVYKVNPPHLAPIYLLQGHSSTVFKQCILHIHVSQLACIWHNRAVDVSYKLQQFSI